MANQGVVIRRSGDEVSWGLEVVPEPVCGAKDLLVAPSFVGMCGSDLELLAGHFDAKYPVTYPVILGHEWSGHVLECGREVSGFSVGDLVVGFGDLGDNHWFGLTDPGAMAERFSVPAALCFKVPEGISPQMAAMVEPLACAFQGLRAAGGVDPASLVVVLGCGTLGLSMIGVARACGATVVAVDPSSHRRTLAELLGATSTLDATAGEHLHECIRDMGLEGADLVVEASGSPMAQSAALGPTQWGSRVMYMGLGHASANEVPIWKIQALQLRVFSSSGAPKSIWNPTLRLLSQTGLDLTPAVSSVLEFGQFNEAVEAAKNPSNAGKVMLRPSSGGEM